MLGFKLITFCFHLFPGNSSSLHILWYEWNVPPVTIIALELSPTLLFLISVNSMTHIHVWPELVEIQCGSCLRKLWRSWTVSFICPSFPTPLSYITSVSFVLNSVLSSYRKKCSIFLFYFDAPMPLRFCCSSFFSMNMTPASCGVTSHPTGYFCFFFFLWKFISSKLPHLSVVWNCFYFTIICKRWSLLAQIWVHSLHHFSFLPATEACGEEPTTRDVTLWSDDPKVFDLLFCFQLFNSVTIDLIFADFLFKVVL